MSLETFMIGFNGGHRMLHQGDAGSYEVEMFEERHTRIITRTPYPGDFVYGVRYGFTRRLLPVSMHFTPSAPPKRRFLPAPSDGEDTARATS